MQNELLTVKTVDVDKAFLDVKDMIVLEDPKKKTTPRPERTVQALVDIPYELLDDDEKTRRRLAGYRITADSNGEETPSKEAPYKRGSIAGPVQYKDISAKPKEARIDAMKSVAKGYLGLEFNALNEVKHEHHVEKKKEDNYGLPHDVKREVKGEYSKEASHPNNAHFHADGTFHAERHGHNNSEENKSSYSHSCSSGCGNSYVGETHSHSINFRARAA